MNKNESQKGNCLEPVDRIELKEDDSHYGRQRNPITVFNCLESE